MVLHIHSTAIWRCKKVLDENGQSRSTHYLRIAQGLWTKPVRLGPRAVGWPAREVEALNAARIAGRSDDQIRALVTKLHSERGASNDEPRDRTPVTVHETSA